MKEKSPYQDMSHEEYKRWFRKNRRKRKLLPVFDNVEDVNLNMLKTEWVLFRGGLPYAVANIRIKRLAKMKG